VNNWSDEESDDPHYADRRRVFAREPPMTEYAGITPHHLAALSLRRAADALSQTAVDPTTWFFIILDLHRALYCALIAALSGPAENGAYPVKPQAKWHDYFEASRTDENAKPPLDEDRVLSFTELLARAENASPPLELTALQRVDIMMLNKFRDDLEHVKPRTWSLEVGGLPRMGAVVAEASKILLQSFSHRLEEEETDQVQTAISKLKEFALKHPSSAPESWDAS
jgi:hypothetical protein